MSIHEFMEKYFNDISNTGEASPEQVRFMLDCVMDLVRFDEREFRSRLRNLFYYMLKYCLQSDRQRKSWIKIIREQSRELSEFMDDDVFISKMKTQLDFVYQNALQDVKVETHLEVLKVFQELPDSWSIDNVTDSDFIEKFLWHNVCSKEAQKYLHL